MWTCGVWLLPGSFFCPRNSLHGSREARRNDRNSFFKQCVICAVTVSLYFHGIPISYWIKKSVKSTVNKDTNGEATLYNKTIAVLSEEAVLLCHISQVSNQRQRIPLMCCVDTKSVWRWGIKCFYQMWKSNPQSHSGLHPNAVSVYTKSRKCNTIVPTSSYYNARFCQMGKSLYVQYPFGYNLCALLI